MADFFAIRNVDERTKAFIVNYAKEKEVSMAQALGEIIILVQEHLKEKTQQKKYKSIFDTYDQLKFSSGEPHLSKKIDQIAYGGD